MTIDLEERSLKKINLIDKFRQRFSTADNEKLKLPQIIVVGDQSSGKSSILEAISGIKLPRGVNTVTKCPVIIQMRHSDVERKQIKCRDDVFKDIEDTEEEINRVQRDILQNQITEEPITLHIESPNLQTLTIIDLPGIVKTQTSDQNEDIIKKTHDIAKMYMKQENSLIICVLPANQDISTTTTIRLASECNKSKSRIIGVLTKLDKIDEKEASLIPDILQNRKLPIKKGYYGLVVSDEFLALDSESRGDFEKNSFRERNLWIEEHRNRLGLTKFIAALVRELTILINECLPQLGLNILHEITNTEKKLSKYSKYYDNPGFQSHYIMKIVNGVVEKVDHTLVKADDEIEKYSKIVETLKTLKYMNPVERYTTFLFLWHTFFRRLFDGFYLQFKRLFEVHNAPYKSLVSLDDLIKRSRVENVLVFNSSKPFKIIIDRILDLFQTESSECVEKCYLTVKHLIYKVFIIDIDEKFSVMQNDVRKICLDILDRQYGEINTMLDSLFTSEHSYFSQDAIVESYSDDDERESVIQLDLDPPQPVNQKLSLRRGGQPLNYESQPAVANSRALTNRNNKYNSARRLKECLEKYIKNLILRLGDSVPNLIRLNLFVNFKKAIESELSLTLFERENMKKYFSLDGIEEEKWLRLLDKQSMLKQSKKDHDDLMASER